LFQTRVRNFGAFIQATHYDAEGGMSSAMKQEGLGRRILSWKFPGIRRRLMTQVWVSLGKTRISSVRYRASDVQLFWKSILRRRGSRPHC